MCHFAVKHVIKKQKQMTSTTELVEYTILYFLTPKDFSYVRKMQYFSISFSLSPFLSETTTIYKFVIYTVFILNLSDSDSGDLGM